MMKIRYEGFEGARILASGESPRRRGFECDADLNPGILESWNPLLQNIAEKPGKYILAV
jgi:hypothetical protein